MGSARGSARLSATPPPATVEAVAAEGFGAAVPELTAVLHACVAAGASVGFVPPFTSEDAARFWEGLGPQLRAGGRRLLVARERARVVGAVTLVLDTNGRHRADCRSCSSTPTRGGAGPPARSWRAPRRSPGARAARSSCSTR